MASIDRTAYPRLKQKLTEDELKQLYQTSDEELNFVHHYARGDRQQLTLLVLLKTHRHLGYAPSPKDVPKQIREYLCRRLGFTGEISVLKESPANKPSFHRYRQSVRTFLDVRSWSDGGVEVAKQAVGEAAYTMSDPADLINVAIETLIQNRYELPAFSALDRLAGHIRQQIHERLYRQITSGLSDEQCYTLDELLEVREDDRVTGFNRIKQMPRTAT